MRRLSRAHEDARNVCEVCGQFGWKGNPVTRRTADPTPKHIRCRARSIKTYLIAQPASIVGRRYYVGTSPMGGREWTSEPADAAHFADPLKARMLMDRAGLRDVELELQWVDEKEARR